MIVGYGGARVLRRRDVLAVLGVSQATLYRLIRRGEFPRPVQLGPQAVGWRSDEVQEWLDTRERAMPWTGKEATAATSRARSS